MFLVRHPRESGDPSPDRSAGRNPYEMGSRFRGNDGRENERGFTLVELMVVIVIIGLLATIVALNVLPSGDTARIQKAKADIATIEQGLEMFKLQNGSYPSTAQGLPALTSAPAGVDASRYQAGGYIKKLPNDPWGRPYLYAAPGRHSSADIWTLGADAKEGGEGVDADIGSWM